MLAATPAQARDLLLLQQTLLPDEAGTASLLIDRDRILLVRGKKAKGTAQLVEVILTAQPPLTVELHCVDQAAARQLIDALRLGGPVTLDVSGRCQL